MQAIRKQLYTTLLAALLAATPLAQAADAEADADWKLFGGILSLVQSFVHIAATNDDPQVMQERMDRLLAGRDAEANRIAGDLMKDMGEDMPAQYRSTVSALARDVLAIARREQAREAARGAAAADVHEAIQARKDLAAMGLRYWDEEQFREAARRNDAIALDLYARGRGIDEAVRARVLRTRPSGN